MGNTINKSTQLIDSISSLKNWSNKDTFNVIFDSDIHGDGWSNNVLRDTVYRRSNLYFITFDINNNVFGGYLNKTINTIGCGIEDDNSFVFSLIRNGGCLYAFGDDIHVQRINNDESYCKCDYYDYNNEQNPLINIITPPYQTFQTTRIIVIEMN
ncbi:TLDc domain-containing protein [Entamoeba marina]